MSKNTKGNRGHCDQRDKHDQGKLDENNVQQENEDENSAFEQERLSYFMSIDGFNPYPSTFRPTISFENFEKSYSFIEANEIKKDLMESIAGRVLEKRNFGKNLFFYTISSNGRSLQYLVNLKEYGDKSKFSQINNMIHRGDIVGAHGYPGKSKTNELSIYPTELVLLTPCFKKYLPKQFYGINDIETRVKKRYLDMIINPRTINTLKTRSKVIKEIRNYLDERDFIELQTPILTHQTGGANAKPFITHHNDLDQKMYLRIAPELFLKQLVVGGIERVYEIGQQFRNETIDLTHVCEFTSLEFYMAYADYTDMMKMCEELLSTIAMKIHNSKIINYLPAHTDDVIEINFGGPYRKIDIMPELTRLIGVEFPNDLTTEESHTFLDELCFDRNILCSPPRTTSRLLDKLIGHYIEPQCIQPTFLINHPLVMSPLAKNHRDNPQLTERFELFVCGMELANAYTELNNHVVQNERFLFQQSERNQGDEESQMLDKSFMDALKYGLPPTGGFGLGVERLIMFMSNNNSIREVLPFPPYAMKGNPNSNCNTDSNNGSNSNSNCNGKKNMC